MGSWPWTTTPSRVHSGQTKEGVPKWSTHHILCWFSLSTYAQHLGQNDLSTHPSGLSKPLASGDVYTLLEILRSAPVDAKLILVNQDLLVAGFSTSIDQERFIGAWPGSCS